MKQVQQLNVLRYIAALREGAVLHTTASSVSRAAFLFSRSLVRLFVVRLCQLGSLVFPDTGISIFEPSFDELRWFLIRMRFFSHLFHKVLNPTIKISDFFFTMSAFDQRESIHCRGVLHKEIMESARE